MHAVMFALLTGIFMLWRSIRGPSRFETSLCKLIYAKYNIPMGAPEWDIEEFTRYRSVVLGICVVKAVLTFVLIEILFYLYRLIA